MSTIAERYRTFAETEARGASAILEQWALGVAEDPEVQALIAALPAPKQQPNLVFASTRYAGVSVHPYGVARVEMMERWPDIRVVVLAKSTQTNEPGRCAVLLPALARLPGPLNLIEVGASGGLCLYPDRYSYRYVDRAGNQVRRVDPAGGPSSVELECAITNLEPPHAVPQVRLRAGIDLNPIDVADPDDLAWLETLVWPGQDVRRIRLHRAAEIATADPPQIRRGDLTELLPDLVASADPAGTTVVYHSAVAVYLDPRERATFRELVSALPVHWISNEAAPVFPDIATQVPETVSTLGRFILAIDGGPIAVTGPHGDSYVGL